MRKGPKAIFSGGIICRLFADYLPLNNPDSSVLTQTSGEQNVRKGQKAQKNIVGII